MSREPGNIILAPLTFTGFAEELCFTSLSEFLKFLQENGFAQVPTDITNVHIGVSQPTSTQKTDLWVRLSSAGTVIGLYSYDGAKWQQWLPAPNEVIWIHDGLELTTVPPGFTLVSSTLAGWTAPQAAALEALYLPPGAGPWNYFAVQFTGF